MKDSRLKLSYNAINNFNSFAIITVPYLAFLELNESCNCVDDSELVAILKLEKQ